MRFRSRQHLRRQSDFAAIRKEGRRQFGAAFVFSFRERPDARADDLPRFAVVASRRVGPAVVRNRLKRRLRAIFREMQHTLPRNVDVVVTLRKRAPEFTYDELCRHFAGAIKRSRLADGQQTPPADG